MRPDENDSPDLFKFPEDVQDDVQETLAALRAVIPPEKFDQYLEDFHDGPSCPAEGLSRVVIPAGVELLLDRYSRACARLARYLRPGGPHRHPSAGVGQALNRLRGQRSKRGPTAPYAAIIADLDAMDYDHILPGHKKGKRLDLAKTHSVGERSVSTAIKARKLMKNDSNLEVDEAVRLAERTRSRRSLAK